MNEIDIIIRSVKDFFTSKMLMFSLVPLTFVLIIMYVMFFAVAGYGLDGLEVLIEQSQNGEEVFIDPNAPFYFIWMATMITFLLQYSITAWLVGFLVYTIGTIFVMMFSVILTLVIIGFLTPSILNVLHKRHYANLELHGHGTILSPLWVLLRAGLMMVFLFLLFIPLYFIPLINIIVINIPLYYFFHKLLNFDVASTILSEQEYKDIYKRDSLGFRARTLLLYFVAMIPFITLFTAVFYIIYLGNAYFVKLGKSRGCVLDDLDMNFKAPNKEDRRINI